MEERKLRGSGLCVCIVRSLEKKAKVWGKGFKVVDVKQGKKAW